MRSSVSLHSGDAADLISIEDAARLLSVPAETIKTWIDDGTVPYIRTGTGPREQHLIPLQGMLNVLGGIQDVADGLKVLDRRVRDAALSEDELGKVIAGS